MPEQNQKKVCFVYAFSKSISGQMLATTILVDALKGKAHTTEIKLPALQPGSMRYFLFAGRLAHSWLQSVIQARSSARFHFTIGQTWMSLLRDMVPVCAVRFINSGAHIILCL